MSPRGFEAHILLANVGFAALQAGAKFPPEPVSAASTERAGDSARFDALARVGGRGAVVRLPVLGDNYTYLIVRGGEALAVDPGEPGAVLGFLETFGLGLSTILCTHHHADHTGGVIALKAETGCAVAGPRDPRIPGLDRPLRVGTVELPLGGCASGPPAKRGERLDPPPPLILETIAVPGHTGSHSAYLVSGGGGAAPRPAPERPEAEAPTGGASARTGESLVVFTGDCLLPAGCGRVTEGGFDRMWGSLRALAALPGRTIVLAGHEYTMENLAFALDVEPEAGPAAERRKRVLEAAGEGRPLPASTVEEERRTNPFLRAGDPVLKRALGAEGAGDVDVFTLLRERKDRYVY